MTDKKMNNVQKFYKDKTIFITGGSGFMGKVLLEKLLFTCPDLKQIYILMRPKKGKPALQRVEEMFKSPMFHRIRDGNPELFKKIVPVLGDVVLDDLGLSMEHMKKVLDDTDVVFHLAATLKLEATLKPSVEMNLIGTRNVIELAKQMPKLKSMIHLSTAFCNSEQTVMEEKVYDCPDDPNDLIRCAEWMKEETMADLGNTLIAPHPNTYTYTKRLAEIFVRDEFPNLPICIVRPSIVTPAYKEPLPGWVDSLNGPVGILVGASKGVIRVMRADSECAGEVYPVDMAISGLITIAYVNGTLKEKPKEIPVYNMTCNEQKKMPWGKVLKLGREINFQYPMEAGLWYPDGGITTNMLEYKIRLFISHWLPAYFIDFLMFLFCQKRFMRHIQNRITQGLDLLSFFAMRNWCFKSDNFQNIHKNLLSKEEHEMFWLDTIAVDDDIEYLKNAMLGGRQYILKEPLSSLPKARIQMKFMWLLDRVTKCALLYFIGKALLKLTGLDIYLSDFIHDLREKV